MQSSPLHGLLVLDKPAGLTSHDVVSLARRATGERSIGHLGTLDPMATGVLPLLIGKWTRLAPFFSTADKHYTGAIRFGFSTDTFDAEGTPTSEPKPLDPMATGVLPLLIGKWTRLAPFFSTADKHYTGAIRFGFSTDTFDAEGTPTSEPKPLEHSLDRLRELAQRFHGTIEQVPPAFSAKKVSGVPAYKLARQGKPVDLKPARITIHSFTLDAAERDIVRFYMHVSSGGYVRSVAHELGALAGCGGHLSSLRRVQAGPFTLADAVKREDLIEAVNADNVRELLLHPRLLLPEFPAVTADEASLTKLRNGQTANLPEYSRAAMVKVFRGQGELAAIGRRIAGTLFQPHLNLL